MEKTKGIRTVKMSKVNGVYFPVSTYGAKLMRSTGLNTNYSYLDITLLANHLAKYNIRIKMVPHG